MPKTAKASATKSRATKSRTTKPRTSASDRTTAKTTTKKTAKAATTKKRTSKKTSTAKTPAARKTKVAAKPTAPKRTTQATGAKAAPVKASAVAKAPAAKASAAKTPATKKAPAALKRTSRRSRMKDDGRDIAEVWVEYKTAGGGRLRNYLIEYYLDIVKYTAERMHMRLPGEVDVEDLMSAGLFGLMDAIDAFDLERGVKFETYCAQRIRGAIFDELRAMDWVPRLVRSRTAKVDRARKALEMESGRRATDAEISTRLNVDASEYQKLCKDSRPVGIVSLNRKWFETDSSKDVREIDVIRDNRQENPLTEIQRKDLKLLITKGLSRAERLIVILYYYEEMTMKEIGMTLDLSESRVSQMHSSILARLKAQMQHRAKEF